MALNQDYIKLSLQGLENGGIIMMLYPPVPQMLKSVPSRYLLVNVIARRARQVAIEEEEFKIPMDKMLLETDGP